jgi:hypothetical protein
MVDFGYNGTTYKLLIGRGLNGTDPMLGEAQRHMQRGQQQQSMRGLNDQVCDGASGVVANLYSYTGRPLAPWDLYRPVLRPSCWRRESVILQTVRVAAVCTQLC